jgi:leucyl-tRNA synthetase
MKPYDHKKIESKWQKKWFSSNIYKAKTGDKREKFFGLIEFPFPSGEGLHIGHVRSNTAMDIITRKRRMQNYNVLYPIGWDSFGLPTENYAIKTGIAPQIVTKKNTANFRRQLKAMGFGFDWSREIDTSDPKYYKWTQWIFLQLLKQGLAYKKKIAVNWCPKDKTGLANEEVIDGCCERCGTKVERREKEQWILAITKYADRLHSELDATQFEERIKIQQRNWIGKSEGALINFKLENNSEQISVFTTRPDTIFGVSYVVLAPEHELVSKLLPNIKNQQEVLEYVARAKETDEITRSSEDRQKTGVALQGVFAVNSANGQRVPVWIADYVLAHYGTGAVMAVPAHDTRDHSFAKKYSLPVVPVIEGGNGEQAYTGDGTLINSGQFNGKNNKDATKEILSWIGAIPQVTFKLRDWVFSRQRYWGEPIPVVHCAKCGIVPVPEKDLPLKLPKVKNFQPTDSGESPLALATKWVNTKCPQCKGKARRETDTMPNWAGSSWYYLRYADTRNSKQLASKDALSYWNPVDWYNGGMEHTTLHLLYSRFWHKFLFDLGIVPTSEPYMKRTSHGMIAGEGGVKMSKSLGNVISPDSIVEPLGADTLRVYEMFMGPFSQGVSWNTDAIAGSRRFIERVWKMQGQCFFLGN